MKNKLKCPNCGSDRHFLIARTFDTGNYFKGSKVRTRIDGTGSKSKMQQYKCVKCGFPYSGNQ